MRWYPSGPFGVQNAVNGGLTHKLSSQSSHYCYFDTGMGAAAQGKNSVTVVERMSRDNSAGHSVLSHLSHPGELGFGKSSIGRHYTQNGIGTRESRQGL